MAARKPELIKGLYVEAKGKPEAAMFWLGVNLMSRDDESSWLCKILRERRDHCNLTQAELASRVSDDMTKMQIYDLEKGRIKFDHRGNAQHAALLDALNLNIEVVEAAIIMDLHNVDAHTAFFLVGVINGASPFGWGIYG